MVYQIYVLGLSLNYVSWCDETLTDFCQEEILVLCKKVNKSKQFENISQIKMYSAFEAFGAVLLVPKLSVSQQSHRFMQSSNEAF